MTAARGRQGGGGGRNPSAPLDFRAMATGAVTVLVLSALVIGFAALVRGNDTEGGTAVDAVAGDDQQMVENAELGQQINSAFRDLGLSGIGAEVTDDAVALLGFVPADSDRDLALGAVGALAGDRAIDTSQLVVGTPSTELGAVTATTDDRADKLQSDISRVIAVTPIIFGQGETDVTELHIRILNSVATIMQSYPGVQVKIVGYTDDLGTDEANQQVSLARASSVKTYLVSQGIPDGDLLVEGRGEQVATGSAGLASLERRVEFEAVAAGAPTTSGEVLRVGVVAPSASNDLAFTQSMVDAINLVATERGDVEVTVMDGIFVPEDASTVIRDWAAEGFDLVIAHGSQYGVGVKDAATEFPDTTFAWGTASDTFGLPNVYAYDAAAEEGGYVQGTLAALLSASETISVVGPIEVGDAERYVTGFETGARAAKPGIQVDVEYIGSFSDITLAAEAAQRQIDGGSDALTGSAQMVVGAVGVARESGALWFGTQANQTSLAEDVVVSSQVYHWEIALRPILDAVAGGQGGGEIFTLTLANGGLLIEYNPAYAVPDNVRQRADQVIADIQAGRTVPPQD